MSVVEKGDDVHGVIKDLTARSLVGFPSIQNCILKVDHISLDHSHAIVGYHAGRFHNGRRYLVDPIRAFFKHYTRLSDTTVSTATLYNSYVSRATDYSPEEVEFLTHACASHYPFFSGTQIQEIISTMLRLRNYAFFSKTSAIRLKEAYVAVDTKDNCVSNCVRAIRPGKSRTYYRQFDGLNLQQLAPLLDSEGIPYVITDLPIQQSTNVIYICNNHARVKVDIGKLRRNL
jgi:hypothetical protein